ncbi:hypothetical protein ACFLU5_02970 [Bacteroidota bacterium]
MEDTINWLLDSDPWVRYRTRIDLLGLKQDHPEVIRDYHEMINHAYITRLLNDIKDWPGKILKRHNDASLSLHKLAFLADIGVRSDEPELAQIINKILTDPSEEGPFPVIMNIPTHFGGSGKDEKNWILCDTPSIQYALIQFGLEEELSVLKAMDHMVGLGKNNGWPCSASSSLGTKFRGPGKKDDPCPYATLIMVKTLAVSSKWKDSQATRYGIETLLNLWQHSYEKSPYLFRMGNDFRKLKAPLIWYDLLHLSEVLSQFDWIYNDPRFLEMINLLTTKADENNRYYADSVWMAWKDWDFGQKKQPSPWITFLVARILKRAGYLKQTKSFEPTHLRLKT